jgi:hypothetical protein
MLRGLEGGLDIDALAIARVEALLHQGAMRDDVETPFLEVCNLVLRLADDDLDDRLVEPVGLGLDFSGVIEKRGTRAAVRGCHCFRSLRIRTGSNLHSLRLP